MMTNSRLVMAHRVVTALHHGGFPGAAVAGGYLRDAALHLQPKDMDVFIPESRLSNYDLEQALYRALGVPFKFDCDLSYGDDSEVKRVMSELPPFGGTWTFGVQVQVIELASGIDPAARFHRYDFGLCQSMLGVDGRWLQSPAFIKDTAAKTCTLAHCESEREHQRSMRRWQRWEPKLAPLGFTLVDPTPWAGR